MGQTNALYFPLDDNLIFPLMIYGNKNGEEISFKVYNQEEKKYYDISEKLIFTNDMILGNALNPIKMSILDNIDNYSLSNPYPNPFNPIINFDLNLKLDGYVDILIYDLKGRRVVTMHSGVLSPKIYNFMWDATEFSSGIYFIKTFINDTLSDTKKIILLK